MTTYKLNPTHYTITDEKLDEITAIFRRETDPAATEATVKSAILADWPEGQDHQEWIDSATAQQIADWIATFHDFSDVPLHMFTDDRVEQINWINEIAANIAENLGDGTAEELVTYALSDEGRAAWGIELPAWFDAHDRALLVERVAESI